MGLRQVAPGFIRESCWPEPPGKIQLLYGQIDYPPDYALPSDCPVFHLQPNNPRELSFVIGHQYPALCSGMRCQPKIVVADHEARLLQSGAYLAVMFDDWLSEWRDLHGRCKLRDDGKCAFARLAFFRAETQLSQCHH